MCDSLRVFAALLCKQAGVSRKRKDLCLTGKGLAYNAEMRCQGYRGRIRPVVTAALRKATPLWSGRILAAPVGRCKERGITKCNDGARPGRQKKKARQAGPFTHAIRVLRAT